MNVSNEYYSIATVSIGLPQRIKFYWLDNNIYQNQIFHRAWLNFKRSESSERFDQFRKITSERSEWCSVPSVDFKIN